MQVGLSIADSLVEQGADLLITGDMGIGNTTPSAALVAAITGWPARAVTGRGTGISDETLQAKVAVVEAGLEPRGGVAGGDLDSPHLDPGRRPLVRAARGASRSRP